jgi:hypothetical protein
MLCINNDSARRCENEVDALQCNAAMMIALLLSIYGQYFGVTIGVTRVVNAMRLIVFLRTNRQQHAQAWATKAQQDNEMRTFVASTIQQSSTLKK